MIVSWARKLEILNLLHLFFFCPAHSNNEGNSAKKTTFLGMHCAVQIHGIYCHIIAKLDKFLSEPSQIQGQLKACHLSAWCPSFSCDLLTRGFCTPSWGPGNKMDTGTLILHHSALKWCLCYNFRVLFCLFICFLPSFNTLLFPCMRWKCDGVNILTIFSVLLLPKSHSQFWLISFHIWLFSD